MTQQVYRLELTERERLALREALEWASAATIQSEHDSAWKDLWNRLRALEPIGTEGGS